VSELEKKQKPVYHAKRRRLASTSRRGKKVFEGVKRKGPGRRRCGGKRLGTGERVCDYLLIFRNLSWGGWGRGKGLVGVRYASGMQAARGVWGVADKVKGGKGERGNS